MDIPQRQLMRHTPTQPRGYLWEHVIAPFRVEGANWVLINPEGDTENVNLTNERVVLLGRSAAFPADRVQASDFSAYHNLTGAESLAGEIEEARQLALMLGAKIGESEVARRTWVIVDPRSPHLG